MLPMLRKFKSEKKTVVTRTERLVAALEHLEKPGSDEFHQAGYARFDFCDCGLDDNAFKEVVNICVAFIGENPTTKIKILDFSGANSLTDGCKDDLIRLIKSLPDTDFISGDVSVSMSKDSFAEVEAALQARKDKGGFPHFLTLNNKATLKLN